MVKGACDGQHAYLSLLPLFGRWEKCGLAFSVFFSFLAMGREQQKLRLAVPGRIRRRSF